MAVDAFPPSRPFERPAEPAGDAGYPIALDYEVPSSRNRFWAIPLIGGAAKVIILIPHYFCLFFLGWAAGAFFTTTYSWFSRTESPAAVGAGSTIVFAGAQLILWIWVLFGGRYPAWGYVLVGGYLRWTARYGAFLYGLTDQYPPFTLKSTHNDLPTEVQVRVQMAERSSRWWAIPIVAWYVKLLILIPHLVVIFVLGVASGFASLVLWIPVLFAGRYPAWGYQLVGGTLRWYTRVYAYLFGLTDRYPPFSLA